MAKKSKLSTPDWIRKGYDSEADYEKAKGVPDSKTRKKGKTFKLRKCPKCGSDDVGLVLSNSDVEEASGTGKEWKCHKCKWIGLEVKEEEIAEDEFMKFLDEKGEGVS